MINPKDTVPSLLTIGNILCGFLSIAYSVDGRFEAAAWLIVLAGFLDTLDGKVARFIDSPSKFGVEFDSLADVCSFGIAPAFLMFNYRLDMLGPWGVSIAFIFLLCGTIRLARFNSRLIGTGKEQFSGLPIPPAALTLASYVIFSNNVWPDLKGTQIAVSLLLALSLLMVSTFEYEIFPRFSFSSLGNSIKLIYVIVACILMIPFADEVLFPFAMVYVLSGVAKWSVHLVTDREVAEEISN